MGGSGFGEEAREVRRQWREDLLLPTPQAWGQRHWSMSREPDLGAWEAAR